jgi:alkylhydroperoxidase family enzyme
VPTHITLGRSVGLSEEQLAGLASHELTEPPFSPTEQLVVRYARRLTRLEPIDDALYAELQRTFTLQEIMELCFTVGISNAVNRFHATFHTPLDDRTRDALGDTSPLRLPDQPGPDPRE